MNKKAGIRIGIVVLLVLMAGISFGPCLKDTAIMLIGMDDRAHTWFSGYYNYLPTFFATVTLIEIILIIFPGKKLLRAIGIVLTLLKLAFPMLYYSIELSGKNIGDFVIVTPDIKFYPPTILGYSLFALGLVTLILYVVVMTSED